jgi:hypothetical protein
MNLRFATHSLRVRVSADEFEQLKSGKSLGLEVSLPRGHVFRTKVNPANEWMFDSDPTGMWLNVPRSEIDALSAALPSREGIMHAFGTQHGELEVSLEVDVKNRVA